VTACLVLACTYWAISFTPCFPKFNHKIFNTCLQTDCPKSHNVCYTLCLTPFVCSVLGLQFYFPSLPFSTENPPLLIRKWSRNGGDLRVSTCIREFGFFLHKLVPNGAWLA